MAVMCSLEDALRPYIGVKMIHAVPMTYGEFQKHKGKECAEEGAGAPGYLVRYHPDNYESWSPKSVFEAAYFPIDNPTKLDWPDINRFVGQSPIVEVTDIPPKTTLVHIQMPNGWNEYEASSCVDHENYDPAFGKYYAMDNIKNKLWKHLGFVLQWARHGLKYKEDK